MSSKMFRELALLGYALFVTTKCKDFMLMLHVIPRLYYTSHAAHCSVIIKK